MIVAGANCGSAELSGGIGVWVPWGRSNKWVDTHITLYSAKPIYGISLTPFVQPTPTYAWTHPKTWQDLPQYNTYYHSPFPKIRNKSISAARHRRFILLVCVATLNLLFSAPKPLLTQTKRRLHLCRIEGNSADTVQHLPTRFWR